MAVRKKMKEFVCPVCGDTIYGIEKNPHSEDDLWKGWYLHCYGCCFDTGVHKTQKRAIKIFEKISGCLKGASHG